VSSSRVKPVIKEKYAGINGRIQGEKKDSRPAIRAAEYVIFSVNTILSPFDKKYYILSIPTYLSSIRCLAIVATFNELFSKPYTIWGILSLKIADFSL
jgi:hypothetical protein